MSATMVRIGGIMVFFLILAVILTGLFLGAAVAGMAGGGRPDLAAFTSTLTLLQIVYLGVMTFVYWTTKGLFNAFAFRRADTPIITVMILMAVNLVLLLLGGAAAPAPGTGTSAGEAVGTGTGDALSTIALIATVMAWIWFAITAIGFGRQVESRLWTAIGIVYLAGMGLTLAAACLVASGLGGMAGPFLLIAGPVTLGGWVCHGIGLLVGAKEMART